MTQHRRHRDGFTLMELTAASFLTIIVMSSVAALAAWNFRDRAERQAQQLAIEAAANILEQARAMPWEQLTPAWGEALTLPSDPWLPDGAAKAIITDEKDEPGLKRVVANVSWMASVERPRLQVELVGFFAKRGQADKGGVP